MKPDYKNKHIITLLLTFAMLDENDSMRDALECMDTDGKKGFILAPGCDLAMETPPENIKAIAELVCDEIKQSEFRASGATVHEVEKLDLTGHWNNEQVVVDVITLDSESCAPCQYMVDAVERAAKPFNGKILFKEHKIKDREGIQMMASLGVKISKDNLELFFRQYQSKCMRIKGFFQLTTGETVLAQSVFDTLKIEVTEHQQEINE